MIKWSWDGDGENVNKWDERENWNRERQKWRKWSGEKIGSGDGDWRKRDWGGEKTGVRWKWRKHQADYKSTTVTTSVRMYNNAQRKSLKVISQEPLGGFRWNFRRTQSQVRGSFATTWIRAAPITRSTRWCSRWSQQSTRRATARIRTKLIE